jgi:transcriptional regulator with XRE-family HTH domain
MTRKLAVGIQALRKARSMTQRALAAKARVTQGYVAQLEMGQKSPSLDALSRLAWALGVETFHLLSSYREAREGATFRGLGTSIQGVVARMLDEADTVEKRFDLQHQLEELARARRRARR